MQTSKRLITEFMKLDEAAQAETLSILETIHKRMAPPVAKQPKRKYTKRAKPPADPQSQQG